MEAEPCRFWIFRRPDEFIIPDSESDFLKWGTAEEEAAGFSRDDSDIEVMLMSNEEAAIWHIHFGMSSCFSVRCEGFLDYLTFRAKYHAPCIALTDQLLEYRLTQLFEKYERHRKKVHR